MGGLNVKCHIEHDVQIHEIKTFGKNSNFGIKKTTQHAAHILHLINKMCKYEMD